MKIRVALLVGLTALLLAGCATTEYKSFEGKTNVFEGKGGTKVVVEGMELWENGEPPRKFKVLGIIDDERPGGLIPMSRLRSDMVKKAREASGDALISLNSQSQIAGYYTSGSASAYGYGIQPLRMVPQLPCLFVATRPNSQLSNMSNSRPTLHSSGTRRKRRAPELAHWA